jgi:hypothetical protein
MSTADIQSIHADTTDQAGVQTWIGRAATLYVSFMLLTSAIAHLQDPYYFLGAVLDYQLLPHSAAVAVAAFVPFLHASIATTLLVAKRQTPGYVLTCMLFAAYTLGQIFTLLQGRSVPCGCFGYDEIESTIGWSSILLSSSVLGSAVLGLMLPAVAASENPCES